MKHSRLLIIPALVAAISVPEIASARENVGMGSSGKGNPPSVNAACFEATAQSDLSVNNVRCRVLMGDMWWDFANAVYEVPKGGGIMAIFAGSLWIGGIDIGGQLKVAAQTYRQTGNDFWPGPLNTTDASANVDVCATYDKHFRITRKEVETFVTSGTVTQAISNWPGNGDVSQGQDKYLAPFFDANGDGTYDPSAGDYPGFDLVAGDGYGECQLVNCVPVDQLFGDECLWWVFNDKGDIHGETKGEPIGLEIRAQAFGFFTDDEINNMTFYNYRIFNRSTFEVDTCYFGVWCDADLGCYTDDFVGCDVKRGFGYTYNGDNDDEVACASPGYGLNPPAIGIDFFHGPLADVGDGKDNDRNCTKDEACEQIIMSGFMYYDNITGPNGNPAGATHFYNYLRMRWGDGSDVVYNGKNGYPPNGAGPKCNFMYPGVPSTDEHDWGIGGDCSVSTPTLAGWDEVSAGNTPNDRRMLESAGPFTLKPGALNVITTGVVWARANAGGAQASVKLLQVSDDKAQALFDNCFKVLDGPNAPDVTVQELDKELILYLSNTDANSNNFNESYTEFDPLISLIDSGGNACPNTDKYYHFEGYKVYQLKDATVSSNDLEDPNYARLVFQCDLKNGIDRIINYEFDQSLGAGVPKEKVNGADEGLAHSIKITTDAFASGAPDLINHKSYYFMAVAYGYNQFKKYQQDMPAGSANMCDPLAAASTGQKKPYKQGRKNLLVYSGIPHMSTTYSGGTEIHGDYGSGPQVQRIEGNGNGGMQLELTPASVSAILSAADSRLKTPTYAYGAGPVDVKVVDPLNVPDGHTFTLKFDTVASINYASLSAVPFQVGDTITGMNSAAKAVITNDNGRLMHIRSIVGGPFDQAETFTGTINAATGKVVCFGPGTKSLTNATWSLMDNTTSEKIYSDKTIGAVNEQLLLKWGLSLSILQVSDPGTATSVNNGFITSSITFADPSKKWLSGLVDKDGPYYANWIRSGTITGSSGFQNDMVNIDVDQVYEGVVGGTWAPYRLCAAYESTAKFDSTKYYTGPGLTLNQMAKTNMKDLASVDVVITSDKTKWSRCVVLEMAEDSLYSANTAGSPTKARKLDYRRALSVDKNGSTAIGPDNNDFATGMGWFPGYAINVETGERLNVAFGENSALVNENGNDMKWNPTSNQTAKTYNLPWDSSTTSVTHPAAGNQAFGSPVFGGQHYIYVFGHNRDDDPTGTANTPNDYLNVPRYDQGKRMRQILDTLNGLPKATKEQAEIFRDCMWVTIPLLSSSHQLLESDVTVRLRVAKSYKVGYSSAFWIDALNTFYSDTASTSGGQNMNLPMYSFSTTGIATHTGQNDLATEALDQIRLVPNPYYAYSTYETSNFDNRVKITNLPEICTVSIYNLSGTLIRKYKKGEPVTSHAAFNSSVSTIAGGYVSATWDGSQDWDLKNTAGVPISSGVYIIHVDVPGVGEKIVKWFGIMRPIDLDSF